MSVDFNLFVSIAGFFCRPCFGLDRWIDQHLFRLLDQREQEKMEWELLEGRVDGRPRAAPLSLSHGLVRYFV